MFGPLAALYTEMFGTRTRYTGASLGYQVAGTGAGLAPVMFAGMASGPGGDTLGVSVFIACGCLLTVLCVLLTREGHRADLAEEPAEPSGAARAGAERGAEA
jgi:hypothetical protein